MEKLIAGIELGGTKTIAIIAEGTNIHREFRIETTKPEIVLPAVIEWLKKEKSDFDFQKIGIATFGPVCLDEKNPDFGKILKTPKPSWSGADVYGQISHSFSVPMTIDTDVNGAALAEHFWGAAVGKNPTVYVTIGTGIGGGIVIDGKPIHGFMHPEMGHMRVKRTFQPDFLGNCPFHGDCLEGLASGPAIEKRTGLKGASIPNTHKIWGYVADEIGEFLANIIFVLSPQIILLGGGVMQSESDLLGLIRDSVYKKLSEYIAGIDRSTLNYLIKRPALGDKAGPLGAIALGYL